MTLLVGQGARGARDSVLALADTLAAPMVLTIKAKEGLEKDNDFEVGQSGLIGNPAAQTAFDGCDVLLTLGTDFPYRDWYPEGKTVIQIDARGEHVGRRTRVHLGLVGHAEPTLEGLLPLVLRKDDRGHLKSAREEYTTWRERQSHLADPAYDHERLGVIRKAFDNPEHAIRPEAVAAAVDRHAAQDEDLHLRHGDVDGVAVEVRPDDRHASIDRLVQSPLDRQRHAAGLGSVGARPFTPGGGVLRGRWSRRCCSATSSRRSRTTCRSSSSCSTTAAWAWCDSSRSRAGCPTSAPTSRTRTSRPSRRRVGCAASGSRGRTSSTRPSPRPWRVEGRFSSDVITNPDEVSLPGRVSVSDAWGFAIAKVQETIRSARSCTRHAGWPKLP